MFTQKIFRKHRDDIDLGISDWLLTVYESIKFDGIYDVYSNVMVMQIKYYLKNNSKPILFALQTRFILHSYNKL